MDKDGVWVLTLLVKVGLVENGLSVRLKNDEINSIKADKNYLEGFLEDVRICKGFCSDREVRSPVWP